MKKVRKRLAKEKQLNDMWKDMELGFTSSHLNVYMLIVRGLELSVSKQIIRNTEHSSLFAGYLSCY